MLERLRREQINWSWLSERGLILLLVAAMGLYAIWPWLSGAQAGFPRTVIVYGFSILGEVMNEGIFPAFQGEWEARTGEKVEFISSFAGSGTITNQILLGVPAEIAILALELDAFTLADRGALPGETWKNLPNGGVLNRSPFVIVVRPGNPKGIRDFADLTQPGLRIVHPDPLTSGGAQWAILAEYGSVLLETRDEQKAYEQLRGVWINVAAQAASARAARTQFENGFGDVLITYEQDVVNDRASGEFEGDIVYPRSTIFSEHTVVVVDKHVGSADRELVQAFIAFLWSDNAQRIFTEYGFRSIDERHNAENPTFGVIAAPFLVKDLGGWREAKREIVEAIWKNQVLPEIGR
jgi:sulfate/thiosulfate transport system substrate-binding protein